MGMGCEGGAAGTVEKWPIGLVDVDCGFATARAQSGATQRAPWGESVKAIVASVSVHCFIDVFGSGQGILSWGHSRCVLGIFKKS